MLDSSPRSTQPLSHRALACSAFALAALLSNVACSGFAEPDGADHGAMLAQRAQALSAPASELTCRSSEETRLSCQRALDKIQSALSEPTLGVDVRDVLVAQTAMSRGSERENLSLPPAKPCGPSPVLRQFSVLAAEAADVDWRSTDLETPIAVGMMLDGVLQALQSPARSGDPAALAMDQTAANRDSLLCPHRAQAERVAIPVTIELIAAVSWAPRLSASARGLVELRIQPRVSVSIRLTPQSPLAGTRLADFGPAITDLFTNQGLDGVWALLSQRLGAPHRLAPQLQAALPDLAQPYPITAVRKRLLGYQRDLQDELMAGLRDALELDAADERLFVNAKEVVDVP